IKLLNENRFLSIAEAFSWDSGNYSCKGVNQVGEEKLNFKVSVLSPPKFVRYSVEPLLHTNDFKNSKLKHDRRERNTIVVKVMKDEDVTLECLTESSPKAKVHWLKIDFYDSSKNILLDEDEENLFIKSIKESSSFMCYINNTVGNVHKIFQIDVQYAPKLVGDERTEVKHSIKLHHGVNLLCNVEGNPEPQIQWMFNGTKILNSDKRFYFSNDNQIMRIIDINKSNQGKFLCNAVNDYGRLQRVFYVNVEVPIQWSAFGPWTICSVSCGSGGIQYRTRICLLTNGLPATAEDYHCVGENVESRKCNQLACPINGGWGKFSEWSKCPKCIDDAIHELPVTSKRVRKCDSPQPSNGGLDCSGSEIEELECKIDFCPVHGGWSKWSPWSACSKTCGSGHRTRKRECNNPSPKYNGTSCRGENVEFEECKMKLCLAQNLKKSFRSDYEDDFEEKSNESREKYKELAELEIKDEKGNVRNFQFMNHREIEFSSPIRDLMGPNIPKIIVTLDTYKPISEETFLEHLSRLRVVHDEAQTESSSSNNLELDSTESVGKVRKKCIRGFAYNTNNDQCEDINECEEQHQNNCKHDEKCVNVLGSFRCDKKPQRRMKS
ncbi:CLUMA_CG011575, isoform A, partial [Clunio marinus]